MMGNLGCELGNPRDEAGEFDGEQRFSGAEQNPLSLR